MKLSILIPSVSERRNTFLPKSLNMLYGQLESLSEEDKNQVEIIYLVDNKTIMLGDKRNLMIDMAKGRYVAFVDCDDRIEPDYIKSLLEATKTEVDCITFQVSVSINGEKPKICYYSKDYPKDYNTNEAYFRLPNHICCVKKSVSQMVSFPSIKYAEDSQYSKLLKPHLRTEYKIDKVLYHYDFNDQTTVAQEDMPSIKRSRTLHSKPIVDVVFLSDAKNHTLKVLTQQAINTCLSGANGLGVNCIVVEHSKQSYKDAKTYHVSGEFSYNKFCNFGASKGSAEWIMFCNNDLIFTNGWLHYLMASGYDVASPKCDRDSRQKGITEINEGYECAKTFSGWAFMMKRSVWELIGGLDEDFKFWFADNSVLSQLKQKNIVPALIPNSIVTHLGSSTLKTRSDQDFLKWSQLELYNKKYNEKIFIDHPNYLKWKNQKK